jgi:hypothetical protein
MMNDTLHDPIQDVVKRLYKCIAKKNSRMLLNVNTFFVQVYYPKKIQYICHLHYTYDMLVVSPGTLVSPTVQMNITEMIYYIVARYKIYL